MLTDEERPKLGVGTTSVTVVDAVRLKDVPVTVTVYVPGTIDAVGVKVRVLDEVAEGEPRTAVMPLGTPERTKATDPEIPTGLEMLMVVRTAAPPTSTGRLLAAGTRLKLGAGTTRLRLVAELDVGLVPVTVMG